MDESEIYYAALILDHRVKDSTRVGRPESRQPYPYTQTHSWGTPEMPPHLKCHICI